MTRATTDVMLLYILSAAEDGVIPTIGGIKYPKYIITNLSGKRIVSADESGIGALSLTFHCRGYLVETAKHSLPKVIIRFTLWLHLPFPASSLMQSWGR